VKHDEVRDVLDYEPSTGVFRWRVSPGGRGGVGAVAGTRDHEGYVVIRYRGRGYKAHRLAWLYVHGELPAGVVDHINGDKADNRIHNLRDVDAYVNAQNVERPNKNGRSGLRWVSWFSQYQKWKASFFFRKKHYFVGHFDDPAEAHEAAKRARAALGAA
jgi:hypothetical protein